MMIDIKKLTKEDIGREVIYVPSALSLSLNKDTKYKGEIMCWGPHCCFDDDKSIRIRYYNFVSSDKDKVKNNKKFGLITDVEDLDFKEPPKPVEIVTRADLLDLDD